VLSASATVDVAADPLANTGSTPALLITAILALLIMCLGALLVVLRRRRLALE
jgi:LPXTG-motif cell wall-anchored protein